MDISVPAAQVLAPIPQTACPPTIPHYPISIKVNGQPHRLEVEAWVTLLDLLRDRLALTGTKKGCDHGQCGACTVLVDGKRINSCLTLAVMQNGREVTTVEGLATGDVLHPIQQAFIECDALQCGYCTPGQLCSAVGLINEGQAKNHHEVRELMSGNICRCGAYPQIVQAVSAVALGPGAGPEGRDPAHDAGKRTIIIGTLPA
jgi:xanthine dehydrogenase YagT iron-sulfur-binding subunit